MWRRCTILVCAPVHIVCDNAGCVVCVAILIHLLLVIHNFDDFELFHDYILSFYTWLVSLWLAHTWFLVDIFTLKVI